MYRSVFWSFAILVLLLLSACSDDSSGEVCSVDADCPGEAICAASKCEVPDTADGGEEIEDAGTQLDMPDTLADMGEPAQDMTMEGTDADEGDMAPDAAVACDARPQAVLKGAVLKSTTLLDTMIQAAVLQTVEFTAAESTSPGGLDLTYAFELVTVPTDSAAVLTDTDDAALKRLKPDVTGLYEVRLNVTDSDGVEACESATIGVQVGEGGPGLTVVLTWSSPMMGQALDVNLHYRLRDFGTWTSADDTEPRTLPVFQSGVGVDDGSSDWGAEGPQDDSILSVYTDDLGPEVVHHPEPQDTVYLVGASAFSNTLNPVFVTAKVYIDGQLVFLLEDEFLDDEFWYIGEYRHATRDFFTVNQKYPDFP